MGSAVQNVRFLRFFIVLGAGVILTLFIYASYNSNRTTSPFSRTAVAPPQISASIQTMRNYSTKSQLAGSEDEKDVRKNFPSDVSSIAAAFQQSDLQSNQHQHYNKIHNIKNNNNVKIKNVKAIVKYHRQPTIDVEAPTESDIEELDETALREQLPLIDSNNSTYNNTLLGSMVGRGGGEYNKNKIADNDVLIPTSNLQRFIDNADKILKNMTDGISSSMNSIVEKQILPNNVNEAFKKPLVLETIQSQSIESLYTKSKNISTTSTTTTMRATSAAAVAFGSLHNTAQGIPTMQIYESGHSNEELDLAKICPARGNELKLLIIITSAQSHQEARLAIRQTWGHYGAARRDIATVFILGRSTNETLNTALAQENFIYGDLIRGNFLDTYNNLTLKTISALEWIDRHCSNAKHILKTDDDMFINVPTLLSFLERHMQEKRVIYGRLAKKWKPIRNQKSKYYVSPAQFSATIFPAFTTGPAYVMSADIIHDLYRRALQQTYLKLEDVFTTGIVAQQLGVKRVHVNEFMNRRIPFTPCNIRKTISVHMIKANEQFDLWKKLLDQSTKCK